MSARFWMFFRIPFSSRVLPAPQTAVATGAGGGRFRCDTGRSEEAGGRWAGANCTAGRKLSTAAGDGGGGSGGGGGRERCLEGGDGQGGEGVRGWGSYWGL